MPFIDVHSIEVKLNKKKSQKKTFEQIKALSGLGLSIFFFFFFLRGWGVAVHSNLLYFHQGVLRYVCSGHYIPICLYTGVYLMIHIAPCVKGI